MSKVELMAALRLWISLALVNLLFRVVNEVGVGCTLLESVKLNLFNQCLTFTFLSF